MLTDSPRLLTSIAMAPRKIKHTSRVVDAAASKSTSVNVASKVAPTAIVDATKIVTAQPPDANRRSDSTEPSIDSNQSPSLPSPSSPSKSQLTKPNVVTPAKTSPSLLKREIQKFDEAIALSAAEAAQKKQRTKIGITAIDFSSGDGLKKAFKLIKGANATVPGERLELIKAILNSYVVDELKVLWKSRTNNKWPSRKSDAVIELTQILSNEYHVLKPPAASKDLHTSM